MTAIWALVGAAVVVGALAIWRLLRPGALSPGEVAKAADAAAKAERERNEAAAADAAATAARKQEAASLQGAQSDGRKRGLGAVLGDRPADK